LGQERYIGAPCGLALPARFFFTGRGTRAVCKFYLFPEQKNSVCSLSHTQANIGEITMPTPKEYRQQACECLELSDETNQWYVKTALLQLAVEFLKRAARLERSQISL
jgi:hypothetical protein